MVTIFCDLQKAYDTSWRYGILQSLHSVGLRGNLPTFLRSFMEDCTFQVRVGTVLSKPFLQEEGVPQGSVLSVTLFGLAINGLPDTVLQDVHCTLYCTLTIC